MNLPQQQPKLEIKINTDEIRKHKLFVGTPMYGGMCLFSDNIVKTEIGDKTIKWIVDNKYNGKVLSFDEKTKQFVWNKVIGWSAVRNGIYNQLETKKKWVQLETTNSRSKLRCTSDHQCAVIDDVLDFSKEIYYTEAENTLNRYSIRNISNQINKSEQPLFNLDQLSCIIGILLGDGYISKNGEFSTSHSKKQLEYLKSIQNLIGGKIRKESPSGFSNTLSYCLSVPANAQTKKLRELSYSNGKKQIKNILQYINEKSLAFWYCDDGYILKNNSPSITKFNWNYNPIAILCTDSFSKEECDLLCKLLWDKWNIKASTQKYSKYYRIAISVEGSKIFWRLISPYICDQMKYKFPEGYNFSESISLDSIPLKYSASLVTKIKKQNRFGKLYDIEVENTHNFIANGSLVHNCGGMFARSIADLSAICTHHGIELQLHFLFNESLITRARNYIADEFMRSTSTHLMFIDSDIGFDARDVLALLALQIQNPEYEIIGGPYAKKTIAWEKIKQAVDRGMADNNPNDLERFVGDFVFNPKEGQAQIPLYQPVEVREVGTGFMMTEKGAFEKFSKAYPHYSYKPDHVRTQHFDGSREIMQYFQAEIDGIDFATEYKKILDELIVGSKYDENHLKTKIKEIQELANKKSKRYLSEDYWFNQRCHDIGVKTWLCPWMRLQHMGTYVFGGSLVDLAQVGSSATADPSLLKGKK